MCFRFITQLSAGDELAIVTFSGNARINLDPTPVSQTNKEGLHGRVPGRASSDNVSCYSCGFRAALNLVSVDTNVKTVFIVVRGSSNTDEDLTQAEKTIEQKNVPVYGLIVGQEFVNHKEQIEKKFFVISDGTDQQTQFSDVFLAIANDVSDDNDGYAKFYENKLRTDRGGNIEGKFSVEESLRTELKVIINTHSKEDIEKFELVSPSGKNHRFPFVERGSVYFQFRSDAEPGIWTYSITRQAATHLTVAAYAKKTGVSTVQVTSWTSADTADTLITPEQPVIVYTQLTSNHVPVSEAEVEAVIQAPDGKVHTMTLTDTGSGYPDITSGDGIYSGYFTSFSDKPGMYSVHVRVTDRSASARVPTVSYVSAGDCCGSAYPAVTTIPSPPFTRYMFAASFYIGQGAQYLIHNGKPMMRDVFAPVRVTDLHVSDQVNSSLIVSLSWTAPGDDFDQGTADYYRLKCSVNRTEIEDSFDNVTTLTVADLPTPYQAGSLETASVEVDTANTVFYCGLVTGDEAGNESPVSNIVTIFVRQEEVLDDGTQWTDAGLYKAENDDSLGQGIDNMLIYIITGGGIIIVIILIFVIICITHKPKKEKKNKSPMITDISGPTLIHSSSALPGILKDSNNLSNLSVLPPNTNDYSLDYTQNKLERSPASGMADLSWAILPSYSNVAFKKSSETIVDSGFYRAGEAVDNVYEFYQPSAEYAIYQQVNKEKKFEDISDNGTATTDCEISDTHSDKILRHFAAAAGVDHGKVVSSTPGSDFHSLIVTSEDFKKADLDGHGPVSLPHYSNFEDFAERRRRRESFV